MAAAAAAAADVRATTARDGQRESEADDDGDYNCRSSLLCCICGWLRVGIVGAVLALWLGTGTAAAVVASALQRLWRRPPLMFAGDGVAE